MKGGQTYLGYPELNIKVIYEGVTDALAANGEESVASGVSSQVGISGPRGFTPINKEQMKGPDVARACVSAPQTQTMVACFKISAREICSVSKADQFKDIGLHSDWYIGEKEGPIHLNIATKVSREVYMICICILHQNSMGL